MDLASRRKLPRTSARPRSSSPTYGGRSEAAFDAGDLEAAAALRGEERQLLADKLRLESQLTADAGGQAIIAEDQRLHCEVDRLRELLRQHGVEPDGSAARTA